MTKVEVRRGWDTWCLAVGKDLATDFDRIKCVERVLSCTEELQLNSFLSNYMLYNLKDISLQED